MNEMDKGFDQVVNIINQARENAFRKVNEELILMYQAVGKFLSERAKEAAYGDGYIDALSEYIQDRFPGIQGFPQGNLYCATFSGSQAPLDGAYPPQRQVQTGGSGSLWN